MNGDGLPTAEQRMQLGMLLQDVLVYLRYAEPPESQALAYAFHNLPAEMLGWGTWDVAIMRGRIQHFDNEHPAKGKRPDFLGAFNAIFPPR